MWQNIWSPLVLLLWERGFLIKVSALGQALVHLLKYTMMSGHVNAKLFIQIVAMLCSYILSTYKSYFVLVAEKNGLWIVIKWILYHSCCFDTLRNWRESLIENHKAHISQELTWLFKVEAESIYSYIYICKCLQYRRKVWMQQCWFWDTKTASNTKLWHAHFEHLILKDCCTGINVS